MKLGTEIKIVLCKNCSKEFKTTQNNPKQLPKYCSTCLQFGGSCIICGTAIPLGRETCGKVCFEKTDRAKKGHLLQGSKLVGLGNPMSKQENREKVRKGVKESYNKNNGALRKVRAKQAEQMLRKFGRYQGVDGKKYKSSLEIKTVETLVRNRISFEYERPLELGERVVFPDFFIQPQVLIEVCGYTLDQSYLDRYCQKIRQYLELTNYHIVVITYPEFCGVFAALEKRFKSRLDVLPLQQLLPETLYIDKICNVDYGHFLPDYPGKCSQLHCHTSYAVNADITGYVKFGMVVDFKDLKQAVKDAVSLIDHKMVIGLQEIGREEESKKTKKLEVKEGYATVWWKSFTGLEHLFKLPSEEVFVLEEGYATLENICLMLCREVMNRMPGNVIRVGLEMQEGVDNGAKCEIYRDDSVPLERLVAVINYHNKF